MRTSRPRAAGARPARTRPRAAVLGVLVAAALGPGVPSSAAAEHVVTITRDGVQPAVLQVAPGDTVAFVNEDRTFAYRAVSRAAGWQVDSGPDGLLPGRRYAVPDPLPASGSYAYTVADDARFAGQVVAAGASGPPAVATSVPAADPSLPEGTPAPAGEGAGQPSPGEPAVPASGQAPAADPAGGLPGAPTSRPLGLPAALAAVAALGVGSLLLRVLLAEPVARR